MKTEPVNPFEVQAERAYVVYDRRSGEILHIHEVTAFRGAKSMSQRKEEARALELARRFGHETRDSRVLRVAPKTLNFKAVQRVSMKTRRLITDKSAASASSPSAAETRQAQ